MKIAVLAGGTSTERNVSLTTSLNVFKALIKLGHKAGLVDVFYGLGGRDRSSFFEESAEDIDSVVENLRSLNDQAGADLEKRIDEGKDFFGEGVIDVCREADIVFMGLHGENGENGKIQAAFDLAGIKYTGPGYLSSALSMDKAISKKILVPEGVPMPVGEELIRGEEYDVSVLPVPCVVKPACGGSSVGVAIVKDRGELGRAIEDAFKLEKKVLVESFIDGREFSVGVIEGKALPVVEIIPEGGVYDYEHKYSPDGAKEECPADLPEIISEKMQEYAELACSVAGIDTYSRVDELMDENGNIFCLEINTLPGMTPTSLLPMEAAALGMSYEELVQKLVDVSLRKYE